MQRDFSSISPSAKEILLMKGLTELPFARQTAELIAEPEVFKPDYELPNPLYWMRVLHFEERYLSVNQLLKDLSITSVLEISSGFSFRGLDLAQQADCHFIDTDLPEIIEQKQNILQALPQKPIGQLEMLSLNALNQAEFDEVVAHFPPGEIVIINEGLLIYLDQTEKAQLCQIIRNVLKERGGYWITADIYLQTPFQGQTAKVDAKTDQLKAQHQVEENKFINFEQAQSFFEQNGFELDREAELDLSELSAMPYLLKSLPEPIQGAKMPKLRATWRLRLKDS